MTPAPTELRRVLEALDRLKHGGTQVHTVEEAARLLREMARDFAHFAPYAESGARALCPDPSKERARLDAARARWRLCEHKFESNPGMYDTSQRYCIKCGVAE